MKKTAVIICPGRGTYNKAELGYLQRHHAGQGALLGQFDALRQAQGQDPVTALDSAPKFSAARHTRGDNASPLIYVSSFLDAQEITQGFDILAVTGNSMGWYSALAIAGVVSPVGGFEIVNTMGTLMQDSLIGGQVLYPFVDENWVEAPDLRPQLLALTREINMRDGHVLETSIHLGGMLVVAGNEVGLAAFEAEVAPRQGRYPMRLPNHAAFHTHLQNPVAALGRDALSPDLFGGPKLPLVDGRGAVWWPHSSDPAALWSYTLGHQVVQTYDFTRAVQVAAKTFAPDVFIVTGPGGTLGGAVAQSLIGINWHGMGDKATFQTRQTDAPVLVSMGRDDQRALATGGDDA